MLWVLALPNWLKVAAASAVVIGVLQLQHWWTVRSLRGEITDLTQALALEKAATADLKVGLSDVQANRDTLTSRLREQGRAVEQWQVRAKLAESAAALAATRATQAGRAQSEALRAPTTTVAPGHEALNEWLRMRLQP